MHAEILKMFEVDLQVPKQQCIALCRFHSDAAISAIAIAFPCRLYLLVYPDRMRERRLPTFFNIREVQQHCAHAGRGPMPSDAAIIIRRIQLQKEIVVDCCKEKESF